MQLIFLDKVSSLSCNVSVDYRILKSLTKWDRAFSLAISKMIPLVGGCSVMGQMKIDGKIHDYRHSCHSGEGVWLLED